MVSEEEPKRSPQDQKQQNPVSENDQTGNGLFSPRFKSLAAMAGWDEEAILVAALVVEDTPDRESKHKKRSDLQFKTPPSNSRRKRRAQRRSPVSIPVAVLDLDEDQTAKGESEVELKNFATGENKTEEEKKTAGDKLEKEESSGVSCSNTVLMCMDKLKEELSCAICLEICYEPSTTTCGHSFCKKCLRSAADKCGKRCPKCRQLISNGRSCTVNTVLWNTIQLLFPQEVEARNAAAGATNSPEDEHRSKARGNYYNGQTRSSRPSLASTNQTSARRRGMPSQDEDDALARSVGPPLASRRGGALRRRRGIPSQDEDAALALRSERENLARILSRDGSVRRWRSMSSEDDEDAVLALRLQREEFMDAFRETHEQSRTSLSSARANLRAMASRAINIRTRRHPI